MIKKLMVALGIAAAVSVIAQLVVVGAVGRGAARDGSGHGGTFRFEVRKATHGQHSRVEGVYRWETVSTTNTGGFVIESNVRGVQVENHMCRFGGPAIMVRRTPTGPVRFEGHLEVRVVDNREPEGKGHPDTIAWRFVSPRLSEPVSFEGGVTHGDIRVFRRRG